MAAKKVIKKFSTRKKAAKPTEIYSSSQNKSPRFLDYFNFTESYTSLILGIVVVIIASILLVSFFQNRRLSNMGGRQEISATNTVDRSKLQLPSATISAPLARNFERPVEPTAPLEPTAPDSPEDVQVSLTPPNAPLTITPTPTRAATPTTRPTVSPTTRPTATATPMPTITKTPTATLIPTKVVSPTTRPTVTTVPTKQPTLTATPVPTRSVAQNQQPAQQGGTYTVKAGESLWSIAEKTYNDGYKWGEIARANKLSNPNSIEANQKLQLPKIDTKSVAQDTGRNTDMNAPNMQLPRTYTVSRGEDLWGIAVKLYNNGYRWVDIARANNLVNPSIIHSGNVLNIPR